MNTKKLWGSKPYSEANIIHQTRIIGQNNIRNFVLVQLTINPFTIDFAKNNKKKFKNNEAILTILKIAEKTPNNGGYSATTFCDELTSPEILKNAQEAMELSIKCINEMHRLTMEYLEIKD